MDRIWIYFLGLLFFLTINCSLYGQYATSSAGGEWTNDAYWGGSAPPYTNVDDDVTVSHRVQSNSSILFDSQGSNKNLLSINDTLIIYGDLTMGLDDDINVGATAVLIIFGDFSAVNKVSVANGGYFVVLGDFTMSGGNQTEYENTGDGQTYVTGEVDVSGVGGGGIPELDCDPNVDTTCGYGDGSDLFEDPIFDFIDEISDETCSVSLTAVVTDESSSGANDGAINVTLTGATSPSFSWSNDSISEDISGLAADDYGLVVFDGVCVIDTSFTVSVPCTAPSITGTTPAARCGTGTVDLAATASAGTINWYSVSAGGSSLGTGTSFTTPSISATTSYWVDATDGGCTTASRTEIAATVNTLPVVTITGNDSTCVGNVTTLDAGAGFTSYLWSTTETTQTIDVTVATLTDPNTEEIHTWSVTVTDASSCQDNDNFDIRFFRIPVTGAQHHIDNTFAD
jgi:hypothetical protein